MNGKKKKHWRRILLFLLICLYLIRFVALQREYDRYTTVYYEIGDSFVETGLEFTVTGWRNLTYEEFVREYGDFSKEDQEYYAETEEVFYIVDFTVKNPGKEAREYDITSIEFQGSTWSAQVSRTLSRLIGEEDMMLTVQPGEGCSFSCAYQILSLTFKERWEKALKEEKHIVFSMDPEKKIIVLSEDRKSAESQMESPSLAFREDEVQETPAGEFQYEPVVFEDGTAGVKITWYLGRAEQVKIPEEIDGQAVVEIGDEVFEFNTVISYVSVPDTVERIGKRLFNGCSGLQKVKLPAGKCTEISEYCFSGCSSLQEILIPEGYVKIGEAAFYECEQLKYVELPETMCEIGKNAFESCVSLEDINTEMLSQIEDGAFRFCSSLKTICLGEKMDSLGTAVFLGCSSMIEIDLKENNTFEFSDGALYRGDTLWYRPAGVTEETLKVREGTLKIEREAAWGCGNIKAVIFPESLEEIGMLAFSNCSDLQSLVFPVTVKIGQNAFAFCGNLKSAEFMKDAFPEDDVSFQNLFYLSEDVVVSYKGHQYEYEDLEQLN